MNVLLGIGDTADPFLALDRTLDRAEEAGDDLTVAILDMPDAEAALDDIEAGVRERIEAAGVDATVRRLDGDPGSRLVEVAEAEGFDAIVLDGGETSPMGKIKISTVAEFVLLNSHVTVTLVR